MIDLKTESPEQVAEPASDAPKVEKKKKDKQSIKCVVWDLDNTVWDGILLEDQNVTVRPHVVDIIKQLDERGILHSVASRNDHDAAMAKLKEYAWPGNVRELRNIVERMAILTPGECIGADAIPTEIRRYREAPAKSSVQEAREAAEREHILRALDAADWNVSSAARALGLERTNLHNRMRALGVTRER